MSTIWKHPKSGIFHIHIRVKGRRKRFSLKTRDRKLAEARRKMAERELNAKQYYDRMHFAEFMEEYLEFSRSRKAPATTEKERVSLEIVKKYLKPNYIDDITPSDADRLITMLSKSKPKYKKEGTLSPFSINSYLAAIKSVFGTALKWQYIGENPFAKVSKMSAQKKMARIFTFKEIHEILSKSRELMPAMSPFFEFLLLTGARRGEALNLEWKDVDFERNLVCFTKTKGKKPRTIFMVPKVAEILSQRRELKNPFSFKAHRVTANFKTVIRAIGIEDASLHDLRKSFSSYLQNEGMPQGFVAWFIGHTHEATTQNYYTGFYDDLIKGYLLKVQDRLYEGVDKK